MEDNQSPQPEASSTEVVADKEKVGVSLRDKLEHNFDKDDETATVDPAGFKTETEVKASSPSESQNSVNQRVAVAAPADMNKAEKEAFLNPTPQNAHILQQYLSRRAYETRSDYQRKTAELDEYRKKVAGVWDSVSQYEPEYARQGINLADLTRRSIEWDRAMQSNPVETALEWLDAYGLSLDDLTAYQQQGNYQSPQPEYLTKDQAEAIAQEKINAMMQQQQQSILAEHNYNAVQSFIKSKPLFRDPGTAAQLEEAMAPIVAALVQQGGQPQEILETAYNYVTKGNPTFSALAAKLEAPVVVEQKSRETQKAKAATRSITGSTGSGTPRLQVKDMRENLRRRLHGSD